MKKILVSILALTISVLASAELKNTVLTNLSRTAVMYDELDGTFMSGLIVISDIGHLVSVKPTKSCMQIKVSDAHSVFCISEEKNETLIGVLSTEYSQLNLSNSRVYSVKLLDTVSMTGSIYSPVINF